VDTQPPYAYTHIERTYSEWKLSAFPGKGAAGTCVGCHFPRTADGGYPTRFPQNPRRARYADHAAVGAATWVQDALLKLPEAERLNETAVRRGQTLARELLKTAATLELSFPAAGQARVRVTNRTGHKLPTGYPEGRRMWLQVRYLDADGKVLGEIGRYGPREMTVGGKAVSLPTLLDPEATRVYECLPGLSEAQARKYGKSPGKSFFFILNDVIVKDNRIPPEGFANAAFAERLCGPVGARYADGQHWDDVELALPAGTARVEARLLFQSVSAEYMVFFAETDRSGPWGRRVYDLWTQTGHCPPVMMAEASSVVPG
jgi:hypothetical protein